MKLRDLRDKISKAKESDMDNDVVVMNQHVRYAKSTNYNKRDGKFSSRIFEIVCESG